MSDITDINRDAWNSRAQTYDTEPYMQKINTQIETALQSRLDWIGADWAIAETTTTTTTTTTTDEQNQTRNQKGCRLLDYACGTGKITRAFQTHITEAVGIDISPAMVNVYNERMEADRVHLANSEKKHFRASAAVGDFMTAHATPPPSEPGFRDFDIAVVGLGFHHFDKPGLCLQRLGQRLKGGSGVCLILDWLPGDDGHAHGHGHAHNHGHGNGDGAKGERPKDEWEAMQKTVKHHGFDEATMKKLFDDAGFVDFKFDILDEPFVLQPKGRTVVKRGFLARGTKA